MTAKKHRLQAFGVFSDEITQLNRLYWLSSYAFGQTSQLLSSLSPDEAASARVGELLPTTRDGEARNISIGVDELARRFEFGLATLRTTSILYVCSAFEAFLCNAYALGALYRPSVVGMKHPGVPSLLSNPHEFNQVREKAIRAASDHLKGEYSKRIETLRTHFKLEFDRATPTTLDNYYKQRNLVAHDQGLNTADAPDQPATLVLAERLHIDESNWKRMIADFCTAANVLEGAVRGSVVTDSGLSIAFSKSLDNLRSQKPAQPEINLKTLLKHVSSTWRIAPTRSDACALLADLGVNTRQSKRSNSTWLIL